jgi:hypothetical protein
MIDTVEFRIHDIKLHLTLAEYLDRKQASTGKTITMRDGGDDDFSPLQKLVHKTYIMYHDTGTLHQVAHFNELKSSHYSIAYKIDYLRDFISFNISVPKYIYGTNILLYNIAPSDKRFDYSKHSALSVNLRDSYKKLYHFFNKFFKAEFGEIEVHPKYIEVNRIDICYNQVFDSKEDSLEYLNQLRKLRKKFARAGSNYSRDWQTSIMYKTDRYSFKVYHKGSEFKKNDGKKLRELVESGAASFDVPYYQTFADKILRYEMTFRNSYMSYLYMNKLFRVDCHIWEAGLKLWKTAKAKKANADNYMKFRAALTAEEKRLIDYVNSFINKTKNFYLASDATGLRFDLETDPHTFSQWPGKPERFYAPALFSPELFDLLAARFLGILEEFKLELKEDTTSVLRKLESRNARIDSLRNTAKSVGVTKDNSLYSELGRKISPAKIKVALNMLEGSTYEEVAASGIFSARTWLNIRNDLKELGVSQTSLNSISVRADLDLRAYWSELIYNSSKFKNLRF